MSQPGARAASSGRRATSRRNVSRTLPCGAALRRPEAETDQTSASNASASPERRRTTHGEEICFQLPTEARASERASDATSAAKAAAARGPGSRTRSRRADTAKLPFRQGPPRSLREVILFSRRERRSQPNWRWTTRRAAGSSAAGGTRQACLLRAARHILTPGDAGTGGKQTRTTDDRTARLAQAPTTHPPPPPGPFSGSEKTARPEECGSVAWDARGF